jgi:predicted metal-dependent peptidase
MNTREILEDVEKSSIQLMLEETFYGHFFTRLVREIVSEETSPQKAKLIGTAAIMLSNNILSLVVNEKFWNHIHNTYTEPEDRKRKKYGLIKHEILHILFKHIFLYNHFSDKDLSAIAVDLVVNQFIKHEQLPDIDKIAILENFPEYFPDDSFRNLTTDGYYAILVQKRNELEKKLGQMIQGKKDSNGQGGQGQSGEGEDGKSKEEKQDGLTQSDIDNNPDLNQSEKMLAKFLSNNYGENHSSWEGIGQGGNGSKEFIENWINTNIKAVSETMDKKSNGSNWRGTLPTGIQAYLEELINSLKPTLDWKKVFKQFHQNSIRSYKVTTKKRRSKRFNTIPGSKVKRRNKIMIAIDTSGSVDDESLAEFFGEVHHVFKAGAEVHIVECDAQIGNVWQYKGKFPKKITGRGGTDFNPPIKFANEEMRPDAVIYLTDGYCPPPIKCNYPILWILSKNNSVDVDAMTDFQGTKVKMDF